jgi:hypothetical protein
MHRAQGLHHNRVPSPYIDASIKSNENTHCFRLTGSRLGTVIQGRHMPLSRPPLAVLSLQLMRQGGDDGRLKPGEEAIDHELRAASRRLDHDGNEPLE